MNLIEIIDKLNLENIDQEQFLKPALRRGLFKKASEFSLKAALTSLPFAMIALPQIVKASTQDATTDVLNFALKLEYLEEDFYSQGMKKAGLITDTAVISQIHKHEAAHVALLLSVLKTAAEPRPNSFDFGTAFDSYANFLTIAQALEDTGVRAYKGQAGVLKGTDTLTVALQIHSVEARHAAEIRKLRGLKGWISGNTNDGAPAAVYAGEENANGLVPSAALKVGTYTITQANISEAFDEFLTKSEVLAIAGPFIK